MTAKTWISKHVGIVDEVKVQGALEYLRTHPHPWALARFDLSQAENALKQIWAEVYGEQTGPIKDKEAATDRDPRVKAARDGVSKAQLEVDAHSRRIKAAESFLDIFQTESANTRSVGNLR